jgi:putative membrane-bound dehydrogenase-like protein
MHFLRFLVIGSGLWLSGLAPSWVAGDEPAVEPTALPRIAPLSPDEALSSFRVRPGFRIELVVAEPMIRDPIELCFDEEGRMFVVEMIDYSERRDVHPHLGRIRLLEDSTGDGRPDRSTVYADDLPWPTGLVCWDGGVFVGATPDIWFLKDEDGDGKAEVRRKVFTGFGIDFAPYRVDQLNMQAMLNSFRWGLDNRIYGVTGPNGGEISCPLTPDAPPVNVRGRDFAFDPRTLQLTAEAGGGQYGQSFDDRGRRFTCSNSDHVRVFMAEARYTGRNPWFAMPRSLVSIAADGPAAPVFRTSPEEPWRVLRTQWRVSGLVPGPIEGGGRASGYFTSATGLTIYRGDAWPDGYVGDAFIADCGSNLLHRKRIRSDGVSLIAERPADERATEFVTSSDVWFRPVQFANAPDGTLYVIDMYREIIEHPWSLPPGIKEQLDLNSGNDRGRIYRIVPDGFEARPRPRLRNASTEELVQLLAHDNAWHRETAARLLHARQDRIHAVAAIEELLAESDSAMGRLHALYALAGQGGLRARHVTRSLTDPDDRVRAHAVKLAERFTGEGSAAGADLADALVRMTPDPSAWVRYQLAYTLGEIRHPERVTALASIIRRDARDPWVRAAVLSSLAEGTGEMLEHLRNWFQAVDQVRAIGSDPQTSGVPAPMPREEPPSAIDAETQIEEKAEGREAFAGAYAFLRELVEVIGARNDPVDVAAVLAFVEEAEPAAAFALAHALGEGLKRARAQLAVDRIEPLLERAAALAADRRVAEATRVQAVELLGLTAFADSSDRLLGLLRHDELPAVQLAALRTLGRFPETVVGESVVDAWPALTPRLREEALRVLLGRADRVEIVLRAVGEGTIRRTDFSSVQLDFLMNHRDAKLRAEALRLLVGPATPTVEALLDQYQPALELAGDPGRGRTIFAERCASCHRADGEGFTLGPELASVRGAGKPKLLADILDPSRDVLPQYLAFEIETLDGESLLGVVADETAAAITLRQAYGLETVVPRDRIKSMRGQGRSIMPDNLEAELDAQAMADLLEYVVTAGP